MSEYDGHQYVSVDLHRRRSVMLALAEPYLPAVRSPWPRWILESDRLSWKQAITKPTWLNLTFDMTYDGGTLAWTSRVGRLPASKMTGKVWRA